MPLRVLSLGAGVQSTCLLLMADRRDIPGLDCAIFADTGAEPDAVYKHLEWLESEVSIPIHRVSIGNLFDDLIEYSLKEKKFAAVPFYTESGEREGRLRRQCTKEYKLSPIRKKTRELLGKKRPRPGSCETWIGITVDEATRMKPSGIQYIVNRWPLIELGMNRNDCLKWMERQGYPEPVKSACTFCPFHNNATWRTMKLEDPKSWNQAVEIDKAVRNGVRGTVQKCYLHRSLTPLEEIDFRNAEDRGQLNLFENECEGLCGT